VSEPAAPTRSPRAPWAVFAAVAVLLVPIFVLATIDGSLRIDAAFISLAVLMIVGYSTVGVIVASRQPGNAIGWLMLLIGAVFAVTGFSSEYAKYTYITNPGGLPARAAAAWISGWGFTLVLQPLALIMLLFPDGRPASPRWRPFVIAGVAITVGAVITQMFLPSPITVGDTIEVANPLGIQALAGAIDAVQVITVVAAVGILLAGFASLIQRFRHAGDTERQQLRWLMYVTAVGMTLFLVTALLSIGLQAGESRPVQQFTLFALFVTVGIGLPAALGISILRFRLYDLDVVVKKTVVFGILVVLLAAVFLVVVAAGVIVGGVGSPPVTFVLGVLVWPMWRLSQRIADRVVYGGRASPYEVLQEFSERASDTYAAEDVLPRMAAVLAAGTRAKQVTIWLVVGGSVRPAGAWPAPRDDASIPLVDGAIPSLPGDVFDVRHHGELLGAISLTMPVSDPIGPGRADLVRGIAGQAGLVLRNARLIEELRASRQRLVVAQDEERRKIERNLHDGAQQQLVALAVQLKLARSLVERDPPQAVGMLETLQDAAGDALEELRALAHGIYPPLLADKGLGSALEAQARRAAVPTVVTGVTDERFRRDVEAAVYFSVLEALNNVAKYAEASAATVTLERREERLVFEVRDDGRGFDAATTVYGSGLQGITDRLDAIGGTVMIESSIGAGTIVRGSVPTVGA
jgi:signal transduction histidine kinase